jgi:hypothetical protein
MAEDAKPSTIMEDAIPIVAPEPEYPTAVLDYPTAFASGTPQSDSESEFVRGDVGLETPEDSQWQILPAEYADSQIQAAYSTQLPPSAIDFEV